MKMFRSLGLVALFAGVALSVAACNSGYNQPVAYAQPVVVPQTLSQGYYDDPTPTIILSAYNPYFYGGYYHHVPQAAYYSHYHYSSGPTVVNHTTVINHTTASAPAPSAPVNRVAQAPQATPRAAFSGGQSAPMRSGGINLSKSSSSSSSRRH